MTPSQRRASAEQYIDRVILILRQHEPKATGPSAAACERAIREATSAFAGVRPAK